MFTSCSNVTHRISNIFNDRLFMLFTSNSTPIYTRTCIVSSLTSHDTKGVNGIRARLNALTIAIYLPFESNGTIGVKTLPGTGISSILCSGTFLLFFVGEFSKASMLKSVAISLR